jgi:hypothetical protein
MSWFTRRFLVVAVLESAASGLLLWAYFVDPVLFWALAVVSGAYTVIIVLVITPRIWRELKVLYCSELLTGLPARELKNLSGQTQADVRRMAECLIKLSVKDRSRSLNATRQSLATLQACGLSASELLLLPGWMRDVIVYVAAKDAAKSYAADTELTDFEAFGENDLIDEPPH